MSRTGSAYCEQAVRLLQVCAEGSCASHLAKTGSEHDNLVDFAHLAQKVVDAGAFNDVDVVHLGLDFHWDNVVGRRNHLGGGGGEQEAKRFRHALHLQERQVAALRSRSP